MDARSDITNATDAEGPVPHRDLGGFILGSLTADEDVQFRADLADDSGLRREVDELADLPRLLGLAALVDDANDVALPPRALPSTATLAPSLSPQPIVARAHRPARRRTRGLAAAAVVAVLVGVGAVLLASRNGTARPDRQVALAVPSGSATAGDTRGTVALYRENDGVGVRLTMTGLEPNEPGGRYECWWVGRNGKVSAGSFRAGPSGVVDVRLNVAGSLDGPVRINVNKVTGTSEKTVLTADVA